MANALLAKDILKKIIAENVPFSLALKQSFKHGNIAKEDKSVVSAVVGCALRHYIVMERLLKDAYPEIESEGLCALLVAFSNALFIKKLAQDECDALVKNFLKEEDTSFSDFVSPYLEEKKLCEMMGSVRRTGSKRTQYTFGYDYAVGMATAQSDL